MQIKNETPLMIAARQNRTDIVAKLIDGGTPFARVLNPIKPPAPVKNVPQDAGQKMRDALKRGTPPGFKMPRPLE